MRPPTKSDWGSLPPGDLDAQCARQHFLGKSYAEAIVLFRENALFYQEDLQSMPASAFNFYAPALVEYLRSEHAKGDPSGASSFLHTVAWMFKTQRNIMTNETQELLLKAAEEIAGAQEFYEADTDIYGEFLDVYIEIKQHFDGCA